MTTLCFNAFNESAYFGGVPDLSGQIDAAARVGFDAIGLDVFSLSAYRQRGGQVEALAERIQQAGIRCPEIASLMIGEDPAETEAQLAEFEPAVRALRPDWILVNSDQAPSPATAGEFRRAADRLGRYGARLAVEFLAITRIHSIADALELIDLAGVADAGVLVDTWHFFLGPDDWSSLAQLPLERIAYVQFDDHPAIATDDLREETIDRRVFPGEGLFDLERFSRTLRARGFDGLVSVEVLSKAWRGGDIDAFIEKAYRTSAPYWR